MTLRSANIAALVILGSACLFWVLTRLFNTPTAAVQSAWTTAGIVGALVTAVNLKDALADRHRVVESGEDGDRLFIVNHELVVEVVRLGQMLAVAMIGLYLLTTAPAISAAQRRSLHIPEWTTASIIITAGLLGVVFGTVIVSLLDRRMRRRFLEQTPMGGQNHPQRDS